MCASIILSLISIILLSVALSTNEGLFKIHSTIYTDNISVGIYNNIRMHEDTAVIPAMTEKYRMDCFNLDKNIRNFNNPDKELRKKNEDWLFTNNVELFSNGNIPDTKIPGLKSKNKPPLPKPGRMKILCNITQIFSPILLFLNLLIFVLMIQLKMNLMKNTKSVSHMIKLLSGFLICVNISLISVIVLNGFEWKKLFYFMLYKLYPFEIPIRKHSLFTWSAGFGLMCGSLGLSLFSLVVYLMQPVKKG